MDLPYVETINSINTYAHYAEKSYQTPIRLIIVAIVLILASSYIRSKSFDYFCIFERDDPGFIADVLEFIGCILLFGTILCSIVYFSEPSVSIDQTTYDVKFSSDVGIEKIKDHYIIIQESPEYEDSYEVIEKDIHRNFIIKEVSNE